MVQEFISSFLLGLATPLTAACVLPLYPGFLSYLSRQFDGDQSRKTYALFGGVVVAGVISFMLSIGLLFSTVIQVSLTTVTQIISPIAFGFLGAISLAMIFNLDFQSYLPVMDSPEFDNPLKNAFGFGFFFGAIVLPCNPGYITVFLARATLFSNPVSGMMNFLLFGLGIGFPLLAFSLLSSGKSKQIINLMKSHEKRINQGTGLIMLTVSVYYLVYVFKVLPV